MSTIRRGILLASADRYFAVLARVATLIVTARLLTPAEIGIAVLGSSVLGMANLIRDFGGTTYLIQVDEPSPKRVQTVFTINLLLTLPLAVLCLLLARPLASFYGSEGLAAFLSITSVGLILGPFGAPVHALLRRQLAFKAVTIINLATTATSTIGTIVLAYLGVGCMSFAWAGLASSALYIVLCHQWQPSYPIYRIAFHDWRNVMTYGLYDTARCVLIYLMDNLPLMVFGKTLGTHTLGIFQRATSISNLPFTTLLAGVGPVILPVLSHQAREGKALAQYYLRGITYLTALLWPAVLSIVLLAHPIVILLLGPQWQPAVPLAQIMAASYLFWFPASLTQPVLIASGYMRDTLVLSAITVPVVVIIQSVASLYGVTAVAWSSFVTVPFFILCSVHAVRRRIPFAWSELLDALRPSVIVAVFSAAAPTLVVATAGGFDRVSIVGGAIGLAGAAAGWLVGLKVVHHPMLREVERLRATATGASSTAGDSVSLLLKRTRARWS
jgi:O-antigen/teichoic acid export membrane protein